MKSITIPLIAPTAMESRSLSGKKDNHQPQLDGALQEFETLFASTLLRTAREESNSGWLGSESSAGSDGIMEFAEQHMARALASKGSLGIAKTVREALAKRSAQEINGS